MELFEDFKDKYIGQKIDNLYIFRLGECITGVIDSINVRGISDTHLLKESIHLIIPTKYLGDCEVLAIRGETLYFKASNTCVRQGLFFEEFKILKNISKIENAPKIKRLMFF